MRRGATGSLRPPGDDPIASLSSSPRSRDQKSAGNAAPKVSPSSLPESDSGHTARGNSTRPVPRPAAAPLLLALSLPSEQVPVTEAPAHNFNNRGGLGRKHGRRWG